MIKINLISSKKAAAPSSNLFMSGDAILSDADLRNQGLLRMVLLIIGPIAFYLYQDNTLPQIIQLKNQRATQLAELKSYNSRSQSSVNEIVKIKEEEAKIQVRINYIDQVAKNRLREIKVMDLIQQLIPEKIWLTRMDLVDSKLSISGMAMTDTDVSSFMEALTKSIYFLDVNLINSSEQVFDGLNVKRFEIACNMEKPKT